MAADTTKTPAKKKPRKAAKKVRGAIIAPDLADQLNLPAVTAVPVAEGGAFVPMATMRCYHDFVNGYLSHGVAERAARECGLLDPKAKTDWGNFARRLLQNDTVRTILTEQYNALLLKSGATVERVWAELSRIAFLDARKIFDDRGELLPMNDLDEDTARAIAGYNVTTKTFGEDGESVEKEVKFVNKDAALAKLIQLHGMVKDDRLVIMDPADFLKAIEAGQKRAKEGRTGHARAGK